MCKQNFFLETCLGDRLISSALSNQEYALKSSDKKRRLRPGSIEGNLIYSNKLSPLITHSITDTDTDTESNGKPISEKKKSKKLRRGKGKSGSSIIDYILMSQLKD